MLMFAIYLFLSLESPHEVPAVLNSLWKKLDFTLNQIK